MAAYRIAQVPEARSPLLSSLAQQEQPVFTDPAPANEGRALSPDGWTLVSAGAGRVTAYDVATGRPVRTFGGIGEAPVTAAMGPDGDTLALAGGGRLELWSLRSGRRLGRGGWMPGAPADYDGRPASLEFSPGGGYIVVRANLGGPYVELSNVARRALEKQDVYVSNARVGPGDRFAALEITEERTVTALRALPGGGTPAGKRLPSRGLQGQVMAISPDGALQTRFTASGSLLLARTGDTVRGWSVPGFTETGRLGVPRKGEPIMRVSPDGRTVVTISSEDLTTGPTFWDAASGR